MLKSKHGISGRVCKENLAFLLRSPLRCSIADTLHFCICFLLLAAGLLPSYAMAGSDTATPVIESDAVCAKCHQEIFRAYLGTPMANASGLATDRLVPGTFLHAASGVEYQVFTEHNSGWLSYRKRADPAINGRERLEYFLGSGHLGLTYLYTKNGYLLESPVAYYSDLKTYDMKPGMENIDYLPEALPVDSTCLRCHMSAAQRSDPGTENRYAGPPFLHTGVSCESCHGDTLRHVATNGTASVVNPIKLGPAERDSTCIVCHLEGATRVEHRNRSVLAYVPGQNITDYLSYFAYGGENTTRRGVSEIEQFSSSKCKRMSGAAMSCMNCHDPHRSPAPAERAAFFRAKCLTCHSQPEFANTHHADKPDCTGCHMPKTGAKNIPHVAWTDHRIRRHPSEDDSLTGNVAGETELTPILAGSDLSRDLALAYYDLAVKGNTAVRPRAMALLTSAARVSPDDAAVLQALGILAEWNGETDRSKELYKAVLKLDPYSLAATTNLGTLLAKSGDFKAAAALWRPAFERNQDNLILGQNLTIIECLLGEKDRAVDVLKHVLIYSPDAPTIRRKLQAIETGSQQCAAKLPPLTLQNP
jgi:predicted CXXCH cytochrome family protein